jgi:hypothetical protein
MPTLPLPLLHQLLRILHIPIFPPTLSSVSPSLLLLILESLLGHRLDLPRNLRLCETTNAEISVIKCILGVLADDLLGMDLTLVDPLKVVAGEARELEVVIMAYAVVAKRKGLVLTVPTEGEGEEEEVFDWSLDLEEEESSTRLQDPIEPDISFSSPSLTTGSDIDGDGDVFTSTRTFPAAVSTTRQNRVVSGRERCDGHSDEVNGVDENKEKKAKRRTVLDEILEEFGG